MRQDASAQDVIPHLPSGLATQATEPEQAAAADLCEYYWSEHPATKTWPN